MAYSYLGIAGLSLFLFPSLMKSLYQCMWSGVTDFSSSLKVFRNHSCPDPFQVFYSESSLAPHSLTGEDPRGQGLADLAWSSLPLLVDIVTTPSDPKQHFFFLVVA